MVNSYKKPEARASGYDAINALSMAVAVIAVCGLVWIALTEYAGRFPTDVCTGYLPGHSILGIGPSLMLLTEFGAVSASIHVDVA